MSILEARPPYLTKASLDATYAQVVPLFPTMTQSAIQAKLDAAPAGSRLWFAPGNYTLAGTALAVKADNTFVDALGATFTQTTWATAVFDLLNVAGCTTDIGLAQYVGTRGGVGTSFRGSSGYTFGAGVWANRDRNHIRHLRTKNLPIGVYFSSWDGVTSADRLGVANRIGHLECEGYNFGVLWVGQKDLVIEDIYAHDDLDDSAGVNPTHAYYASGTATMRSTGVTILKARCENNLAGQAFQLKYVDQASLTNHKASNCKGLINILDCDDLTWTGMDGVGMLATGTASAVSFGFTTAVSKRPVLNSTSVRMATGVDETSVSVWADDAQVNGLVVEANRSAGTNTAQSDVAFRGDRGRARGLTLRSVGAGHARGVTLGFGATTVTGWDVDGITVNGQRSVLDVVGGGSGNAVRYNNSLQTITGGGAPVTITGTATLNEVSVNTQIQAALSTLGDNPAVHALVAATPTVPVANNGIQVLITPRRDMTVASLVWFSASASGNYDLAIVDDTTNTRLWSKGSTVWPAAGTVTETVTGVTLRAGRTYRIVFAADNTVGTYRGVQSPVGDMLFRADGLYAAYLTSALFPVPAAPGRGTGASTRIPLVIIREA